MPGIFDDLGQGLQNAGAALNPQVMAGLQQQRAQQAAALARQREQQQAMVATAIQTGAMDPSAAAGFGLPEGLRPNAQTQERQVQMQADQVAAQIAGPLLQKGDYEGALAAVVGIPGAANSQFVQRLETIVSRRQQKPMQSVAPGHGIPDPNNPGQWIVPVPVADKGKVEPTSAFAKELKDAGIEPDSAEGKRLWNARLARETAPTNTMIKVAGGGGGGGGNNDALTPEDTSFMAKQYLAGDRTVMQNLGRGVQGSKNIIALRKAIREEAKAAGMTPEHVAIKIAEFEGLKAGERTAGTREAQLGFAAHELEQFIPLAEAAGAKVPRTGFKPINQLIQLGENQWSPEQAAFVAANRSVINAFSLVASRGAQTVHNVVEAENMLNTAFSHDAYKAVLKQLDVETKAALRAPKMVREDLADRGGRAAGAPAAPAAPAPATRKPLSSFGSGG